MTTETQERTHSSDEVGVVTESAPPPSEPPPSDTDWSEVTAVAVPQSRQMKVVAVSRNAWHPR